MFYQTFPNVNQKRILHALKLVKQKSVNRSRCKFNCAQIFKLDFLILYQVNRFSVEATAHITIISKGERFMFFRHNWLVTSNHILLRVIKTTPTSFSIFAYSRKIVFILP